MSILAWIVLGVIAGAIANATVTGPNHGGVVVTVIIGIVGACLGGFLGNTVSGVGLWGFSLWGVVLAIVGAMILLWIYATSIRQGGNYDGP